MQNKSVTVIKEKVFASANFLKKVKSFLVSSQIWDRLFIDHLDPYLYQKWE
jgi:hypothetical protein